MYFNEVKREKRIQQDFLKIPFPHTSAYNPDDDPYILELDKKCDHGKISDREFKKGSKRISLRRYFF